MPPARLRPLLAAVLFALAGAAAAADPGGAEASARFRDAVALMDAQRDAEAMAAFERLTQDFPELAEPYNNIALLHARAGRLDEALAALQTALRNQPANDAARRNLGEIHLRLAIRAWESAASGAPADLALAHRLRLARELAALPR